MSSVCSDAPPLRWRTQAPLPGQVHAAVGEAGGRIEVLPAGSQHQANAGLVAHPVRGLPSLGSARWRVCGTLAAVHHLPSQVDVFKATGTQETFGKYLRGKETGMNALKRRI